MERERVLLYLSEIREEYEICMECIDMRVVLVVRECWRYD